MKKILLFALMSVLIFSGCQKIQPTKTIEDLKAGIKGKTTASAKYAAFAQKAADEGQQNIARLFMAASRAEAIHAANHTKVLEGLGEKMPSFTPEFEVKTTADNLKAAQEGENYESTKMYPQFIADAKAEKVEKALKSFNWANDTEKKHEKFYASASNALASATQNTLPANYVVCPVCGNTYDKSKQDDKCAFCQTKNEKFEAI